MPNPHAETIARYADLFLDSRDYVSGTNRGNKLDTSLGFRGGFKRVVVDYAHASRGFRIMDRYGEAKLTIQRAGDRRTDAVRHIIALSLLKSYENITPGHEITVVENDEVYKTMLPQTIGSSSRPGGLILEPFNKLDRPVTMIPDVLIASERYAENFAGRLALAAAAAGLEG